MGLNQRSRALTWPGAGGIFASERSIVEPHFGNEKNVEYMRWKAGAKKCKAHRSGAYLFLSH